MSRSSESLDSLEMAELEDFRLGVREVMLWKTSSDDSFSLFDLVHVFGLVESVEEVGC